LPKSIDSPLFRVKRKNRFIVSYIRKKIKGFAVEKYIPSVEICKEKIAPLVLSGAIRAG